MPDPDDLARQADQHLDSLTAAGVEFVPRDGPAPKKPRAKAVPTAPTPVATAASLFEEALTTPVIEVSPDERRQSLHLLADQVSHCPRCPGLVSTRTQTVFGVGPVDAELCVIGEAPGGDEDRIGEPFVGAAGQMLDRILSACGFDRSQIFICNVIKCRPPGNRTPQPDEITNCREYLEKQLEFVRPKFIVAFGGTAATNLLETKKSLGQLRGKVHRYRGTPVVCTYHPAFLLPHRQPEKKRDVWEDMKLVLQTMGRPIPGK